MTNEIKTQSLQGMRAIVTGGGRGIGEGICLELALEGAIVAVVDHNENSIDKVIKKILKLGGSAVKICSDIGTKEACQQIINTAVDKLGGLDILVNNAAPSRDKSKAGNITDADWDIHQNIVLNAPAILADAASKHLKMSGQGAIVNISSVLGEQIGSISWPYHVSKAGLNHLTRWLAVRFGSEGIRVNAVSPGLVDRDEGPKLSDNLAHKALVKEVIPLGRPAKTKEIAQAVAFLCSKKSSYITGQILVVDGGGNICEGFSNTIKGFDFSKNNSL
ncbi:SDR family oxidoreductase [Methylophilaceae bacterium]|nr:SDR family oxidoreductase [Methylophilaceae bacterium]MDC1172946.1 SDR family oxidoreductase [Methylophilaceae bacterium]